MKRTLIAFVVAMAAVMVADAGTCLLLADVDYGLPPPVYPRDAILPLGACAFMFALFAFLICRETAPLKKVSLWIRAAIAFICVNAVVILAVMDKDILSTRVSDGIAITAFLTGFALAVNEVILVLWCLIRRRFAEIQYHVLVFLILSTVFLFCVSLAEPT